MHEIALILMLSCIGLMYVLAAVYLFVEYFKE